MIDGIYKGRDDGNMTEHEYFHIREDYFSGTKKSEVMPMIVTKNSEILYLRKRKIKKLYDKTRIF